MDHSRRRNKIGFYLLYEEDLNQLPQRRSGQDDAYPQPWVPMPVEIDAAA